MSDNETITINDKLYSIKKQLGMITFQSNQAIITDDLLLINLSNNTVYSSVYDFIKDCDTELHTKLMNQINKLNARNQMCSLQQAQKVQEEQEEKEEKEVQKIQPLHSIQTMKPVFVDQKSNSILIDFLKFIK